MTELYIQQSELHIPTMCWVGNATNSEETVGTCFVGNRHAGIAEIWEMTDGVHGGKE